MTQKQLFKWDHYQVIKERASFNARYLVQYVAEAQQHSYNTKEAEDVRRMAKLYMYRLNEDIDMLYYLEYIDIGLCDSMKDSVWNYYCRVYR